MERIVNKIKNNRVQSAALICLLTVSYLFATAAFAQNDSLEGTAISNLTYARDPLSYGDVWAFSESLYNESAYGTHNPSATYYYHANAGDGTNNTKTPQTTSNYYGSVTFADNSEIAGDPLNKHGYSDFVGAAVAASSESSTYDQAVPVMTTAADYGSYAVIPNDDGIYYAYVYYEGDTAPNELVKYHVIESYTTNDAYAAGFNGTGFTASGALTFTRVGKRTGGKAARLK